MMSEVNTGQMFHILPDPQTNGGLMFTVRSENLEEIKVLLDEKGFGNFTEPIGRIIKKQDKG